jgi:hypothetical protein
MKRTFNILLFCLIASHAFTQVWLAGDTSTYEVSMVNQSFAPNATIVFDVDCDQLPDFYIQSAGPNGIGSPWERLSFYMEADVQVYNSNTGFVTTFEEGNLVALGADSLWTEHLDFIYGTSALGSYGQYEIANKYILFRKNNGTDTNYVFILFSNFGINFSIHQIISNCSVNPLEITSGVEERIPEEINYFPNPSQGVLNLSKQVDELLVYDLEGRLVYHGRNVQQNIDLHHLGKGLFLAKIIDQDHHQTIKILIE